jgi:serine/threonine protein kinase
VLDFGLAKSVTFDKSLTHTGFVAHTPAYMSPEQVRGDWSTRDGPPLVRRGLLRGTDRVQSVEENDFGHLLMTTLVADAQPSSYSR